MEARLVPRILACLVLGANIKHPLELVRRLHLVSLFGLTHQLSPQIWKNIIQCVPHKHRSVVWRGISPKARCYAVAWKWLDCCIRRDLYTVRHEIRHVSHEKIVSFAFSMQMSLRMSTISVALLPQVINLICVPVKRHMSVKNMKILIRRELANADRRCGSWWGYTNNILLYTLCRHRKTFKSPQMAHARQMFRCRIRNIVNRTTHPCIRPHQSSEWSNELRKRLVNVLFA